MRHTKNYLGFVALSVLGMGCGNAMNCALYGDNIRGHVIYTAGTPVQADKAIIIEYSTNDFSSVRDTKTISNAQGLIAVPFTYCAENDVNAKFRAYTANAGQAWASGFPAGRDDGDPNGNAPYKNHNLPAPQPSATPSVPWNVDRDVNIWLDSTASQ